MKNITIIAVCEYPFSSDLHIVKSFSCLDDFFSFVRIQGILINSIELHLLGGFFDNAKIFNHRDSKFFSDVYKFYNEYLEESFK